jgi:choline dehydrogenase
VDEAEYVIVGGGSAGCAVANRLSENPRNRVVLVEAGGDGRGLWVDMPVGLINLVGNPKADWIDRAEPDPSLNNREIIWNHGKMLGGGGGINGMVYIRGQRSDYDAWEAAGCTGWGFNDVQPYFMKNEDWRGEGDFQSHGRTGHLSISHHRTRSALTTTFVETLKSRGLPFLEDYCAGDIDGVFYSLTNQGGGRRCSPAKAYLEPIRGRPNLEIMTGTMTNRVLFEDGRAVGVSVVRAGQEMEVRAREIVLCAGATQSPVILMRSGVGPASQLMAHGVAVVADRAGVGQNLMDHPVMSVRKLVDLPSFNSQIRNPLRAAYEAYRYFAKGDGILAASLSQAMAGLKTLPELADPDVLLFFPPFVFDVTKPSLKPGRAAVYPLLDKPAAGIISSINRPYSRGQIRLRGPSPTDRPEIHPGLLSDERDVETLVRAGRLAEQIFATPPMAQHVRGRLTPELGTDDEWRDYIRSVTTISYHASGTCRMGGDADSVVDPRLRVRGVRGLRVIDASIMPVIPSANTNAPSMMIGERGAALMVEDQLALAS